VAEETAAIPEVNIDVAQEREQPCLVSLLFFDYVNQTNNRKLNLIGVFDRVRVNPETKKTHPLGVFLRTGQTYDGDVTVKVFDPNGALVAGFTFQPNVPPEQRSFQIQMLLRIEFETPVEGVYWFSVSYKEQTIGGAGLLVEFRKVEEAKDEHTTGDA
jgi:hypothetical protein